MQGRGLAARSVLWQSRSKFNIVKMSCDDLSIKGRRPVKEQCDLSVKAVWAVVVVWSSEKFRIKKVEEFIVIHVIITSVAISLIEADYKED